jgi:hypothetical protein
MRRLDPFDRRAMVFSIILHGTLFSLFFVSGLQREPTLEFVSYQIDLVSPPPAVEADV